jgi:hypothetical protein
MHQSPLKQTTARRDRHVGQDWLELDAEAERRMFRAAQPRARKAAREESREVDVPDDEFRQRRRERPR